MCITCPISPDPDWSDWRPVSSICRLGICSPIVFKSRWGAAQYFERPDGTEIPIGLVETRDCNFAISARVTGRLPFDAQFQRLPCLQLSEADVPFDTEGSNADIRWSFVGQGGRTLKSHCRHGGITQMRKKEERERAFTDNKIPDLLMHADPSHLHGFT